MAKSPKMQSHYNPSPTDSARRVSRGQEEEELIGMT
eukprot:CAMPEP_0176142824 /NCGR_PEP_ID=MMETSP0120_2-20121206/72678_1 /TAXON_ID=160619 /ORGANISM="Kryptoperidinium foliaceum, Strain CCMP 1326" /LENGTH=35 /DNA_ID= /DNA_START= /DNA_END= /DNA_ORIENTATION=